MLSDAAKDGIELVEQGVLQFAMFKRVRSEICDYPLQTADFPDQFYPRFHRFYLYSGRSTVDKAVIDDELYDIGAWQLWLKEEIFDVELEIVA